MEGLREEVTNGPVPVPKKEELRDWVVRKANGVCTMCLYFWDKFGPHPVRRWVVTAVLALIYGFRVFYFLRRYYMITFLLGAYVNFIFFEYMKPLAPVRQKVRSSDGPIKVSDDFKPFIRSLPELNLWRAVTVAFLIAFEMTFFPGYDIQNVLTVGLLILIWMVLFCFMLIMHLVYMRQYKYMLIALEKKKCQGEKHAATPIQLTVVP